MNWVEWSKSGEAQALSLRIMTTSRESAIGAETRLHLDANLMRTCATELSRMNANHSYIIQVQIIMTDSYLTLRTARWLRLIDDPLFLFFSDAESQSPRNSGSITFAQNMIRKSLHRVGLTYKKYHRSPRETCICCGEENRRICLLQIIQPHIPNLTCPECFNALVTGSFL